MDEKGGKKDLWSVDLKNLRLFISILYVAGWRRTARGSLLSYTRSSLFQYIDRMCYIPTPDVKHLRRGVPIPPPPLPPVIRCKLNQSQLNIAPLQNAYHYVRGVGGAPCRKDYTAHTFFWYMQRLQQRCYYTATDPLSFYALLLPVCNPFGWSKNTFSPDLLEFPNIPRLYSRYRGLDTNVFVHIDSYHVIIKYMSLRCKSKL